MRKIFTTCILLIVSLVACTAQQREYLPLQTVKHLAYTVTYDESVHCPVMVSWTLTKEHLAVENVSRTDEFLPDPDIPSSVPTTAYSRSGFDRGHMAPAADFKWSEQAMVESFYTSNICPQYNELNAGAWLTLEKACRRWVKYYGTIWVVCGPIFKTDMGTIGNQYDIRVPSHFYKVVLKNFKGRWYAMGWIMPNSRTLDDDPLEYYSMSVDDVEAVTGLDFFSWLDDKEEQVAERETDTKYWK